MSFRLMKSISGALIASVLILVSTVAQAQRPNFQEVSDACNRSDTDCKVAISEFVGEGGFAGQRAIDISRRLAWAVRGGKLDARAIACFVEVIYDRRFSASTVNKIIENVGSAGNRVLQAFQIALELEQALDQFEVGSPN